MSMMQPVVRGIIGIAALLAYRSMKGNQQARKAMAAVVGMAARPLAGPYDRMRSERLPGRDERWLIPPCGQSAPSIGCSAVLSMTRRTRVILLVIAASVVVVFLYAVRAVLTPFILAAIAAYLANPLVMRFESRQMPRSVAIISTYIICGISAALIIYLIVPVLIRELNDVLVSLPQQLQGLNRYAQSGFQWLQRLPIPIPLGEMTSEAIVRVQNVITTLAARSLDLIFGLFPAPSTWCSYPFSPTISYEIKS